MAPCFSRSHFPLLPILAWPGILALWLVPAVSHCQSRAWFPHAADPNYQKTYQQYRAEMASRPIVAPALGYDGSSGPRKSPSTESPLHLPTQRGISQAFSSLGKSIQEGWNKLSQLLTPKEKVEKAPEPTSVFNPAKPSADTYVAMARFCIENGRLAEAQRHYLQALQTDPDHLGALLGYAKLQEMQGDAPGAMRIYQRALSLYAKEPSVFNNAGLCYARNGQLATAARLLQQAVQLEPKKPLYRNNLAMVLVDMGRPEAALAHLRAVYPEAVARYNLGQLLLHKGDWDAAAREFAAALRADPSLQAARAWLKELQRRKTRGYGGLEAEVARRPTESARGAWSEVTDLAPAGQPDRFPTCPSGPLPGFCPSPLQAPETDAPPLRLEQPRIYARPGGTFSAEPVPGDHLEIQEELAPLPPVESSPP